MMRLPRLLVVVLLGTFVPFIFLYSCSKGGKSREESDAQAILYFVRNRVVEAEMEDGSSNAIRYLSGKEMMLSDFVAGFDEGVKASYKGIDILRLDYGFHTDEDGSVVNGKGEPFLCLVSPLVETATDGNDVYRFYLWNRATSPSGEWELSCNKLWSFRFSVPVRSESPSGRPSK